MILINGGISSLPPFLPPSLLLSFPPLSFLSFFQLEYVLSFTGKTCKKLKEQLKMCSSQIGAIHFSDTSETLPLSSLLSVSFLLLLKSGLFISWCISELKSLLYQLLSNKLWFSITYFQLGNIIRFQVGISKFAGGCVYFEEWSRHVVSLFLS